MIDPQDNKTSSLPLDGTGAAVPASPSPAAEPPALSLVAKSTIQPPDEAMLREEFDLVRIRGPVYSWDKKEAEKRTANAERVDKHRKKLAAEGLRPASVPITVLDAVKEVGGWQAWQEHLVAHAASDATEKAAAATTAAAEKAKTAEEATATAKAAAANAAALAPPPEISAEVSEAGGWSKWLAKKTAPPPAPKPVVKEVPAKLSNRDMYSLILGRAVEKLTGWRGAMARFALGAEAPKE